MTGGPPAIRVPYDRDVDMRARLLSKAIPAPSGCLIWVAAKDGHGYGLVRQPGFLSMRPSHRVAYELEHGEIPHGLVIDHLCREKKCINPQHLQAVTNRTNVRRGGNPGHRITRVLDGRQSRRPINPVVLAEMIDLAAHLGAPVTPGAVLHPAPGVDLSERAS